MFADFAHYPAGNPNRHDIVGNVPGYHTAGPDDGILADGEAATGTARPKVFSPMATPPPEPLA